ncbi:hypothetical protein MMC20_005732 [Loxospora ochrophaea]|nr:hypothetical protein [Loxospora ochrophaea]
MPPSNEHVYASVITPELDIFEISEGNESREVDQFVVNSSVQGAGRRRRIGGCNVYDDGDRRSNVNGLNCRRQVTLEQIVSANFNGWWREMRIAQIVTTPGQWHIFVR